MYATKREHLSELFMQQFMKGRENRQFISFLTFRLRTFLGKLKGEVKGFVRKRKYLNVIMCGMEE